MLVYAVYLQCKGLVNTNINNLNKQRIMRATTYNKSEIMRQAWSMYRSSFYDYNTFAEALKMAWYYAKQEAIRIAQVEARKAEELVAIETRKALQTETKKDKFYKEFGKSLSNQYRNVTFGKNDWRVSYTRRHY